MHLKACSNITIFVMGKKPHFSIPLACAHGTENCGRSWTFHLTIGVETSLFF
jgi:hypothetical protein